MLSSFCVENLFQHREKKVVAETEYSRTKQVALVGHILVSRCAEHHKDHNLLLFFRACSLNSRTNVLVEFSYKTSMRISNLQDCFLALESFTELGL